MNSFVIIKQEQDKYDKKYRIGQYCHGITDGDELAWKAKFAAMMRKAEVEEIAQREKDAARVCPHCHIVISGSGVCDICGYELH